MYIQDAPVRAALGFLFSELTTVQNEVLRQPYPMITYPQTVPVDTSAPEGTEAIAFKTLDWAGEPEPLGDKSNDVPLVSLAAGLGMIPVHTWALGYEYSLIELKKAATLAQNSRSAAIDLLVEKPAAVRLSVEQWLNKTAYLGDTRNSLIANGLLNYPGVPITSTGALLGGSNMTLDQILAQSDPNKVAADLLSLFNNGYYKVYKDQTNTNFAPNFILMDPTSYGKIASVRIPNTAETYLTYLERVVGNMNGFGPGTGVQFVPLLQLAGAGAGGTNRVMFYTKDSMYVKLHLPMPFQLQAPATANNLAWQSAGVLRTAGTEIRIPSAHLYLDGV